MTIESSCPTCGATGAGDLRATLEQLVACLGREALLDDDSGCESIRAAVLAELSQTHGQKVVAEAWAEVLERRSA